MIIISSCLAGIDCRYDGNSFPTSYMELLHDLITSELAISVCPEVEGGLPTPRPSAEIVEGRILIKNGEDLTKSFQQGCDSVLKRITSKKVAPSLAILKSRSPSCGVSTIYDGTFSGRIIQGSGLFMRRLRQAYPDLKIIDETELEEYATWLRSLLSE